jgi:ABC-2 type transport system permease protein
MAGVISAFASLGFLLHHRGTAVGMASQLGTFARYPLDLFGAPLRWLLTVVVPFGFAGFYGAALVMGSPGWQTVALLQPLVGLVALGLGYGAFRLGLRRYGSSGT